MILRTTSAAGNSADVFSADIHAERVQALDDFGITVFTGMLKFFERLMQQRVVQVDSVTQDMKAARTDKPRRGHRADFHAGKKLNPGRNAMPISIPCSGNRVVIGYGDGPNTLF